MMSTHQNIDIYPWPIRGQGPEGRRCIAVLFL